MKIYLACSAPGNEATKEKPLLLTITKRLLSYHHICKKMFGCDTILETYINENLLGR